MKVVFVLPDMGSGGAERVVSILSKQLNKQGYNVDILMLFGSRCSYDIDEEANLLQMNLLIYNKLSRITLLRKYFKSVLKLDKKVVVVAFQDSCLTYVLASTLGLNVKVVASERSNPYRKGHSIFSRFYASIPYMLCNRLVFQTPDARNYYLMLLNRHCYVICNPITRTNIRWKRDLSPAKLISVCRLHYKKNIEMTLLGIQKLKLKYPNIHLDIYGEGDWKLKLEHLIFEYNIEDNVSFCGVTSDVLAKLSESSIFISTSSEEGISNSMLEAMSVGMPVICTDCPIGGAKMMLSNGAGQLVPVDNVEAFVEKLDMLLSHPVLSNQMAEKGYLRTLEFTSDAVTNLWKKVFNSL